ncbi:type VI secretion system protein ImpA [Collimonas sp. PA-H2]|uniref:type VI secretion system protein TssA n=1 Tax=Collimonas sp. PA-H2 TaxID=1881062 RepID=UPI000BF430D1|nr:type VI secretion system protein TssA [Collimonas sp. PA-H2]PFH08286.1 type VI secretion system protein ImpA [Collimonas sp. PA-H2]
MFSVEQLLNPISDSAPCGADLSFSSDLDAIAHARRFDDPSLDQGEWITELKEADWGFVVDNCARLIETQSKDLRLAVWLSEANAKVRHFRGLADGYLLLAGLSDRFWDMLYPIPDDDDQELRIGNVGWLLSRSVQLVREIPLTEGRGTAFSTIDFESARIRAANEERGNSDGGDGVKLADVESARRKSSPAYYEKLLADANACQQALLQLEKSIDFRVGQDGPAFSAVKEALESVIATITRFAQEAGINTRPAAQANGADTHANNGQNAGQSAAKMQPEVNQVEQQEPQATGLNGPIQNRTQALMQLRHVADFFRRTEPHSPVAYLAEKAAHWGELPLHHWLRTVIKDPGSLAHVEELLGLQGDNQSHDQN